MGRVTPGRRPYRLFPRWLPSGRPVTRKGFDGTVSAELCLGVILRHTWPMVPARRFPAPDYGGPAMTRRPSPARIRLALLLVVAFVGLAFSCGPTKAPNATDSPREGPTVEPKAPAK